MDIVNVIGQVQGFSVLAAGLLISLAALGTGIGFGLTGNGHAGWSGWKTESRGGTGRRRGWFEGWDENWHGQPGSGWRRIFRRWKDLQRTDLG